MPLNIDASAPHARIGQNRELLIAIAIACALARPASAADSTTDTKAQASSSTTTTSTEASTSGKSGTPATTTDSSTSSGTAAGASSATVPASGESGAASSSTASSSTSTAPSTTNSSSNHSTMNSGLKPWPDAQPTTTSAPTVAPKAVSTEPPPPPGMDAALKLYAAKKWPLAQKSFEAMVKNGTANVQVHQCLANCYYYQRVYSKAQVQFEWIAKNEKHLGAQRSAENTARVLRCYRAGVCPASCIKANDPRWHKLPGHGDELWMTFRGKNGTSSWSEHHIGQLVTYVNGEPENGGTCPTCSGSGTVKVLKDGAPPPQQ